jgi:phosphoglycerate dehydrogenase-like enzyme
MNGPVIVATGPVDPRVEEILAPYGPVMVAPDSSEASLLPLMPEAIGLIVRGGGVATEGMMAAAPHLRVIGRSGAGYDSVDLRAASQRGIQLVYVPGVGARAAAEAALTLMLALAKNLFHWDRALKRGDWNSRFVSSPKDLTGATVGIVGLGRIGIALAELLQPFRVRILAYDPLQSEERARAAGASLAGLEDVLHSSDFVSLHAPLTAGTRGMINRATLALFKPGCFFLNLARGGLLESLDALYEALQLGTLAGAGLDVFDPEPPDQAHPIFQLPNVITAPHALCISEGAMRQIFESMAADMAAVLAGSRPRHVVNAEVFGEAGAAQA